MKLLASAVLNAVSSSAFISAVGVPSAASSVSDPRGVVLSALAIDAGGLKGVELDVEFEETDGLGE